MQLLACERYDRYRFQLWRKSIAPATCFQTHDCLILRFPLEHGFDKHSVGGGRDLHTLYKTQDSERCLLDQQ
jgi:hypothetical protein